MLLTNKRSAVTAKDLESLCVALGIPQAGAARILTNAARDIIQKVDRLSEGFPIEMRPLDNLIGETARLMNEELGLDLALRERDAHVVSGGGSRRS
jgi:serine/threonine-protein kinase HipA